MLKHTLKKNIKIFLLLLRLTLDRLFPLPYKVVCILGQTADYEKQELLMRYLEFCPENQLPIIKDKLSVRDIFSGIPVLFYDGKEINQWAEKIKHKDIFYINHKLVPNAAWNWFRFLQHFNGLPNINHRKDAKRRLLKKVCELRKLELSRVYLFGTGTSLEKAIDVDFSDGYRIVCNTIVKDFELWHHLKPHFIVAADAIYHFGPDEYAKAFRSDLRDRLSESNTYFVYPELFDALVRREFPEVIDRLIPIPMGTHTEICCNLTNSFELPSLGNVLNHLLLPLGCTLSKNIYFWGFDGRAPDDKWFWANSNKHFYGEHFEALIAANPAFFNHHVPQTDPGKYARTVHGDHLENCLIHAEKEGKRFVMMHFSWTQTLNKRFKSSD